MIACIAGRMLPAAFTLLMVSLLPFVTTRLPAGDMVDEFPKAVHGSEGAPPR